MAVSTKKKKEGTSSSSKEKKSSKDKEKKKSETEQTSKKVNENDVALKPLTSPPVVHDADAVQLFRRCDRARNGFLTRLDFLHLLKEYADVSSQQESRLRTKRLPLSLTDANGIPLGYERADKNSEFEAGQLFERYDKTHSGTLSLDEFQVFFADFRPQLQLFVEDLSNTVVPAVPAPSSLSPPVTSLISTSQDHVSPPQGNMPTPERNVLREYQTALWELRKLCKDELLHQKEHLLEKMSNMREEWATNQNQRRTRSKGERTLWKLENQLSEKYEAMEMDVEHIDEIVRAMRRQSRNNGRSSKEEMETFLSQAPDLMHQARELALKGYDDYNIESESSVQKPNENGLRSPRRVSLRQENQNFFAKKELSTATEVERAIRIKDEMIFQLLQERTTLRREKASIEASLHDLSAVSTQEMTKWAQLTDEMEAEIQHLREQLMRSTSR